MKLKGIKTWIHHTHVKLVPQRSTEPPYPVYRKAMGNGNHAAEENHDRDHANLGWFCTPDTGFSKRASEPLTDLKFLFRRKPREIEVHRIAAMVTL